MKRTLMIALIVSMGASTAFAQRAQKVAPKKAPVRTMTPKAEKVQTTSSKTDAALSASLQALANGEKLTAAESKLTCDGKDSLVKLVEQNMSASDKVRFGQALSLINQNGAVLQSCQAGEPITQKASLVNLGKLVITVGELVRTNQGQATDKNTWARALKMVLPDISEEQSVDRVEKLSGAPCNLIKLS